MSNERRQHYRVSIATEREVRVSVCLENGQTQSVGLIDVSAGGVAIGVTAEDALDTRASQKVSVHFDSERLGQPLRIAGHMRHIKYSDDGQSIMYGIAFDPWSDNRLDLTPKLRALFNEREAVRVEPIEDEDIEATLKTNGHGRSITGLLRDISVFGLGLWFSAEDAQDIISGMNFNLHVDLPTGRQELSVEVEARHILTIGDRTRVGLRFCNEDAKVRRAQQRDITQYVMTRQIEIARVDAERRRAMGSLYPSR